MLRFLVFWFIALVCEPALRASVSVEIDLQDQRAYLLRHGRVIYETEICSGRRGYETPRGRFKVIEKDLNHRSSLYGKIVDRSGRTIVADADTDMPIPAGGRFVHAPMRYFIRFTGAIGMHSGYLPGYPASHGCVRLPERAAVVFYKTVQLGTPVTVFGRTLHGRTRDLGDRWERDDLEVEPDFTPMPRRRLYRIWPGW